MLNKIPYKIYKEGNMRPLICAFGTDEGISFTDRHFGDSELFDIYELSEEGFGFRTRVKNTSVEETIHADPKKAGSIAGILKAQGVQVVFSKQFGPNITRIRSRFVCIKMKSEEIEYAKWLALKQIHILTQLWDCGEERGILIEADDAFKERT